MRDLAPSFVLTSAWVWHLSYYGLCATTSILLVDLCVSDAFSCISTGSMLFCAYDYFKMRFTRPKWPWIFFARKFAFLMSGPWRTVLVARSNQSSIGEDNLALGFVFLIGIRSARSSFPSRCGRRTKSHCWWWESWQRQFGACFLALLTFVTCSPAHAANTLDGTLNVA